MLNQNIFTDIENKDSQVEKSLLALLTLNKDNNKIFKVNNLEEITQNSKYILSADDALQISSIVSCEEDKNVFLINEYFNDILRNINTSLSQNFYKIYRGLSTTIQKFQDKSKNVSVTVLNMIDHESKDIYSDIALIRNLGKVNIFLPADAIEAEYLIKISEKGFWNNVQNRFSYFRLISNFSPKIFDEKYFINDNNLKEYTGIPEIIYFSKNLEAAFEVLIISAGPILYNSLIAAKELENNSFSVKIVNMSLIYSNSEYINEKIKIFINNLAKNHKNILVVEEHSKIGGLGSFISEIIAEHRHDSHVRIKILGLEDDLSPRNIISKCQEVVGN